MLKQFILLSGLFLMSGCAYIDGPAAELFRDRLDDYKYAKSMAPLKTEKGDLVMADPAMPVPDEGVAEALAQ